MKKLKRYHFPVLILFTFCLLSFLFSKKATVTPFDRYGALHVEKEKLCGESGEQVQLYGFSTHGIAWYPEYINEDSFLTLRDQLHTNLIRISMYTQAQGLGYCDGGDRVWLESLIDTGVKAATKLGMYVIIDWHTLHDPDPNQYLAESMTFFRKMSEKYKNHENVLYELCNEPGGETTWKDIRRYAKKVIPVIRANAPDAVILIGTPYHSRGINKVSAHPLSEYENIMYTAHFYGGSDGDEMRDKISEALRNEIPVFISECNLITELAPKGKILPENGEQWLSFLNEKKLSYAVWSLSHSDQIYSLLKPAKKENGIWGLEDLSPTGEWYCQAFRKAYPLP